MTEAPRAIEPIRVSLVDGDPNIRHKRQLFLRSENYEVRSYATSLALLADPGSRDFPCIVLDAEHDTSGTVTVLREMRSTGWRGHAILLGYENPDAYLVREAERNGDQILERNVGDRSLMAAISGSTDRNWSGWNAFG